ncbi:hypothetical protein BGX24_005643 [Mortierella sp. AD032]|nr:hypothetical protein BGX24_005643 [Mortierella sp. AD032]
MIQQNKAEDQSFQKLCLGSRRFWETASHKSKSRVDSPSPPVCLSREYRMSPNMEWILRAQALRDTSDCLSCHFVLRKIMELNPKHAKTSQFAERIYGLILLCHGSGGTGGGRREKRFGADEGEMPGLEVDSEVGAGAGVDAAVNQQQDQDLDIQMEDVD